MVRGKNQIKSMELEILSCQLPKGEYGEVQIIQEAPEGSEDYPFNMVWNHKIIRCV